VPLREVAISLSVEEGEPGVFIATSDDVPGLVAEGRSVAEAAEIAQGLACKIAGPCREQGTLRASCSRRELLLSPF
jgi:antitoxin HicB